MALEKAVGNIAANTGSVTTTLSGLSFQPKVVIFTVSTKATDNETWTGASASMSRGFTDGTTHRACSWAADNAVSPSNCGRHVNSTRCIALVNSAGSSLTNAATCAMTSDGFTLTWNSTPAAAYRIQYEAFGGSDITNVAIGHLSSPGSATTQDTNIGFVGDFAMFIHGAPGLATTTASVSHGWGWATGPSNECAAGIAVSDGQTMAANVNAHSIMVDDASIIFLTTGGVVDGRADFVSFDQGGTGNTFRVNWSDFPTNAQVVPYLIIKGGQWGVGISVKPATATAQTVTGMAFQPQYLGLGISSATALNTITVEAQSGHGAATSTAESSITQRHNDSINTAVDPYAASTKVLNECFLEVDADWTSFNSDGWTITWDAAGIAKQVMWYAAASDVVVANDPVNRHMSPLMHGVPNF